MYLYWIPAHSRLVLPYISNFSKFHEYVSKKQRILDESNTPVTHGAIGWVFRIPSRELSDPLLLEIIFLKWNKESASEVC